MRRLWLAAIVFTLAAPGFSAGEEKIPILPVSEIKPGMKGIAYTVFEGTEPETVPVEVVGVLKNAWGPRQDIILVHVGGRAAETGVAAGMSGSPVYIDGKWVGAISLRFGLFPHEPLAGVTPAESMIAIQESDATPPAMASLPAGTNEPGKAPSEPVMAALADLLPPPMKWPASADSYWTPIETPLVFSGFSAPVVDLFGPLFRRMGMVAVQGGAESQPASMPSPDELASALPPGAAVSAQLVTGDLNLAATGTVTYNDGQRILAFGHPFFGAGPVEMPMSQAEILTTLGSSFYPFKIANTKQVVGSILQDRHSGILGVLGRPARMIPVTATLRSSGQSATYRYQMFQNQQWTPIVMLITFFTTVFQSNWVTAETSFKLRGAIDVDGYPPIVLDNMSATAPGSMLPPGLAVSIWLSQKFNQIFQNPLEKPEIRSVDLEVDLIPEVRSATIESVWSASNEVHPGEELPVKIVLRPYRGERIVQEASVKIPWNVAKGNLRILFSDAEIINQNQGFLGTQKSRATNLADLISLINRERSNQQLYVTLFQPTPSAVYDDKLLPSIPSTIANVMDSSRATNRLLVLHETEIGQSSIPMDVLVSGNQSLNLTVD